MQAGIHPPAGNDVKTSIRIACAAVILSVASCAAGAAGGGEPADVDVDVDQTAILGGTPITSDPEIGFIWAPQGPCTATLIHPSAILTAAHCFKHESDPGEATDAGVFIFKNFTDERRVTSYISLGGQDDTLNDIAVAKLAVPINPEDGAVARGIASNFPTDPNVQSRLIGYGCEDFSIDVHGVPFCTASSNFSVKREVLVAWWALADDHALSTDETGTLTTTINGDSGGPLIDPSGNIILLVSGATYGLNDADQAVTGKNVFANVPLNFVKIRNALTQLGL
jgi:hypothetical protein